MIANRRIETSLQKQYIRLRDIPDVNPNTIYHLLKLGAEKTDLPLDLYTIDHDLRIWQSMYPYTKCLYMCKQYNDDNTVTEIWDTLSCLDGYSQVTGDEYNSQCFYDNDSIRILIANIYGGIALYINRRTYELKLQLIDEDDGYWFITDRNLSYINKEDLQRILLSEISELHIGFDHQYVIEQIYKLKPDEIGNITIKKP